MKNYDRRSRTAPSIHMVRKTPLVLHRPRLSGADRWSWRGPTSPFVNLKRTTRLPAQRANTYSKMKLVSWRSPTTPRPRLEPRTAIMHSPGVDPRMADRSPKGRRLQRRHSCSGLQSRHTRLRHVYLKPATSQAARLRQAQFEPRPGRAAALRARIVTQTGSLAAAKSLSTGRSPRPEDRRLLRS